MDYNIFIKKLKSSTPNYLQAEAVETFYAAQSEIKSHPCIYFDSSAYMLDDMAVIADNCMKSVAKIENSSGVHIESFSPFAVCYQKGNDEAGAAFTFRGMIWSNMVIGHIEVDSDIVESDRNIYMWVVIRKEDFDKIANYELDTDAEKK